ncbi:cobyric acid synthase [Oscillospiraceae bacterium MB08-C2-2]|nr:cobyric acid synthase [Oscillospiraceae bacterium MB08-C2-2]
MAKSIMIQGTMSDSGKSLISTGLCRIFKQDGFRVAPFKSQNMALNSFITREGLEMGRAQVTQAEAAGVEPSVLMNPILLKPTGETGSQVIVKGEVLGDMKATEYYAYKHRLREPILECYTELARTHDVIVLEGAGSPAEINLKSGDIVNMGMAKMADAPVLLVGDIDRGGVFASLYGTVALLEPEEKARIKGIVINKFRGDVEILRPGLAMLEEMTGIPVVGVVPMLNVHIEEEDGLSLENRSQQAPKPVDIAVIRLPRISNFTDFIPLEKHPALGVRYVSSPRELGYPDLIILPGTKNTMADLLWLRQNGLEAAIKKQAAGTPVLGICGGYQMLGNTLSDPHNVENGGELRGMELLPVETVFEASKTRRQVKGEIQPQEGFFSCLNGCGLTGYEIHMGKTARLAQALPFVRLEGDSLDGTALANVAGCYIHGLFESREMVQALAGALLTTKGLGAQQEGLPDFAAYKEQQYDLLAEALRRALDMEQIYRILEKKGD